MIIPNEAYVVLYDAVEAQFIKVCYGSMKSKSEVKVTALWNKINKEDPQRRSYFEIHLSPFFTGKKTKNFTHFYNKNNAALKGIKDAKEGKELTKYTNRQFEKDNFLVDLLTKFLDLTYPIQVTESELKDDAVKAAILFQVLIERYKPSIFDQHVFLRVYDRLTGEISFKVGNIEENKLTKIAENENKTTLNNNSSWVKSDTLSSKKTTVNEQKIAHSKFFKPSTVKISQLSRYKAQLERDFFKFVELYFRSLKDGDLETAGKCWEQNPFTDNPFSSWRIKGLDRIPDSVIDLKISTQLYQHREIYNQMTATATIEFFEPVFPKFPINYFFDERQRPLRDQGKILEKVTLVIHAKRVTRDWKIVSIERTPKSFEINF